MNHQDMRDEVARQLAARPGWVQVEQQDHHFVHPESGVHILIYRRELTVAFGEPPGQWCDRAVSVKLIDYPRGAIACALEAADALVLARWVLRRRSAVLSRLDGSAASAVALLADVPVNQLDDYGGMPQKES